MKQFSFDLFSFSPINARCARCGFDRIKEGKSYVTISVDEGDHEAICSRCAIVFIAQAIEEIQPKKEVAVELQDLMSAIAHLLETERIMDGLTEPNAETKLGK